MSIYIDTNLSDCSGLTGEMSVAESRLYRPPKTRKREKHYVAQSLVQAMDAGPDPHDVLIIMMDVTSFYRTDTSTYSTAFSVNLLFELELNTIMTRVRDAHLHGGRGLQRV